MKALLLAALLGAPVEAGLFWGPLVDPLVEVKALFEARKFPEVINRLSPEAMQKLRRERLARAYLYLGTSYLNTGRPSQAMSTFQVAVKLFPKDINLLSELAALFHLMGLDEQSKLLFQKVLKIHPNNARAHLGLAELDRSLGFLERSAHHYSRALETMGEQARLWRDYAEVLLAKRDPESAETAIKKSLALAEDLDARIDLALIERALGRQEDALKTLEAVLQTRPDSAVALMRALWCLEAGRFEEARAAAVKRVAETPEEGLARWILARVLLHDGKKEEAAKELRLAAKAGDPDSFVAAAALGLLAELERK